MTARLGVYGGFILALLTSVTMAQAPKAGVLSAEDLKRIVPTAYFFRGQSASVQLRNSVGFSSSDGKLVLAGLVDTSGYAACSSQVSGIPHYRSKIECRGNRACTRTIWVRLLKS